MKKSLVEKILSLSFTKIFGFLNKGGAWYEAEGEESEFIYNSLSNNKEVGGEFMDGMRAKLEGVKEVFSEEEYLGMEESAKYIYHSSKIGDEWILETLIRLRGLLKEPIKRNYSFLWLGCNQKSGWKVDWDNKKGWHSCFFSSYGGNGYSNHNYTATNAGEILGNDSPWYIKKYLGEEFLKKEGLEISPSTPEKLAWTMLFSLLVEKRDVRRGDWRTKLQIMEVEEDIAIALRQFRESKVS